jgi:DNA-binding transcriptional MerR regulator
VSSTREVMERTGLTFRQLDYWARKRHVHPQTIGGTGNGRDWPDKEVLVAELIGRIMAAGVELDRAAIVARRMAEVRREPHMNVRIKIGSGIWLTIGPPDVEEPE